MKRFLIYIILLVSSLGVYAQGDGTMSYMVEQNPPGTIVIKLVSTVNYPIGSALNFTVSMPPMTTLTNFTPVLPGIASTGNLNEYAVFGSLPAITAGTPITLATFKWTSTAPAGTTGTFSIVNDGSNYIEYGVPSSERQGPPTTTALNVPLPIKLSKFDVRPFGDIKASDLRWTSSSEINASHFEVERSSDGINFTYVGKVLASGNSNWAIDYNYVDRSLPIVRSGEEIYYYRLRMVDLDGSAEYSDIRSIRFDNGDDVIVKMGPNPTMNTLTVNMSAPNAEDTDAPANIFDQSGRLVTSKKVNTNGVTEIDLSNYPNGIYNISIEHNGKTYNNRIIKSN